MKRGMKEKKIQEGKGGNQSRNGKMGDTRLEKAKRRSKDVGARNKSS